MRNLKRVLSLALASVMLMGMMVVGSSAAFKDADKIVNDKAVAMAGGFGLFAGDTEGNFNPEGTVTRAQMAAVIAKMFYGAELNADTYKGGNKFTDTASFEGGWAEGYINLGVEKGWFKGYGDGTFKPGQAVTTAEAMTMIINLLGIDAGEGTWPMTVMAAVEGAKLFGDKTTMVELKPIPATNAAMTRDQLAVAVVNGLYYSPEGAKYFTIAGIDDLKFDTMADAIAYVTEYNNRAEKEIDKEIEKLDKADPEYEEKVAILKSGLLSVKYISEGIEDTLADTTFDAVSVYGRVVANQATGEKYTELSDGTLLNLETGLDMLGHNVVAYFRDGETWKTEKNPGTAYCVVDTADYFTVEAPIFEDKKAYTAVFGSKVKVDDEYTLGGYDETVYTAKAGTYAVNKTSGKIDNFIAPRTAYVSQVGVVKTVAGKETIKIGQYVIDNMAENDVIVEYEGIAEDDIVVAKFYGFKDGKDGSDEGKVYVEKLEPVTGKIEATFKGKLNGYEVQYVTIDGKDYLDSRANVYVDGYAATVMETTSYEADANKVYDAYIYGGKLIGADQVSGAGKLEDAIFVVNVYEMEVNNGYGTTTHYYAQGVTAAGEEVSKLIGINGVHDKDDTNDSKEGFGIVKSVDDFKAGKFYDFKKSNDREQAKKDIFYGVPAQSYTADKDGKEETYDPMTETDGYFAVEKPGTMEPGKLTKDDKYLTMGDGAANRLFLTENTKFIIVEKPAKELEKGQAAELKIAPYTGPISKKDLAKDDVYVAAIADANGANKTAELVVIVTEKVALASEHYVYIAADAAYSITADGVKYTGIYFTETEEFKAVTVDETTPLPAGFYVVDEIDEDGIYDLGTPDNKDLIVEGVNAAGVYGNNLILSNDNMYALASDAKVYDVRSEDKQEDSEISEITSLKDIAAAIKGSDPYTVIFDVVLKEIDSETMEITHIFVKSISKGGKEI